MGVIPDNKKALLVGQSAWWGGIPVLEAQTAEEAIITAGLDYEVEAVPAGTFDDGQFTAYPDKYVIRRVHDRKPYMIASDHYQIQQPKVCFDFVNELVKDAGCNLLFETAGALFDGAIIWMQARLPEVLRIAGDDIESQIFLRQTFDGSACLTAGITKRRIVCDNTLTMALKEAQRLCKLRHTGDMTAKLDNAREVLKLHKRYTEAFKVEAEKMLQVKLSEKRFTGIIENLFPFPSEATSRVLGKVEEKRHELRLCLDVPDLENFRNTGWGLYNAVSDMVCHGGNVSRKTKTEHDNRVMKVIDGHELLDQTHKLILAYN